MKWDRGILFGGKRSEAKGAPKTGIARLWEILERDVAKLFLTGLPALAAGTAYGFAVWCGLKGRSILITLAVGLAAGAAAGPTVTGVTDTVLRSLRDEPGFWWDTYVRAWKQNAGQSCIVGSVLGLILSGQIFCLYFRENLLLTFISMGLLIAVFLYVFPQIAMMKLKTADIFRNALLLAAANPKVTATALLTTAVWAFLLWLFMPLSALIWAVGGLWFPGLLVLMEMNSTLNHTFLDAG